MSIIGIAFLNLVSGFRSAVPRNLFYQLGLEPSRRSTLRSTLTSIDISPVINIS